jgi:hypothetical protein
VLIELDDDMTKSAPVEMVKFVLDPVIELDDDMTKSFSENKLNALPAIIKLFSI